MANLMSLPTGTGVEYSWDQINDPNFGHPDQIQGKSLLGSLIARYPGEWRRFIEGRLEPYEALDYKAILRKYNLQFNLQPHERQILMKAAFASPPEAESTLSQLSGDAGRAVQSKVTNWVTWKTNMFIEPYMQKASRKSRLVMSVCKLLRF